MDIVDMDIANRVKSAFGPWLAAGIAGSLIAAMAPAQAKTARIQPPALPTTQDIIEYSVRKGDSLFTLGRQSFDRPDHYRIVQRLNGIADPRRIPVGTVLKIPLGVLRADPLSARIIALRGTVTMRQGDGPVPARIGSELMPGAALETGTDGFVTIQLPNGSRTSMPTRTRLRIARLHRINLTGSIDYDLAVEGGKVETIASPVGSDPNNRFRIRTPRALAAVRGTVFRVAFAEDEAVSLTEVVEGAVAASSTTSGAAARLTPGLGAVIAASGNVKTEALLAPPTLRDPGRVQTDPLVTLAVAPVGDARAYRLQIAEDAGFTRILADRSAEAAQFAFEGIPNGSLFVRASAIAASGLEGMPQTFAMRRVLAGVTASAGMDADTMRFAWGGEGEGRRTYSFQLGLADGKGPLLVDEAGLQTSGIRLRRLGPGVYRWRVGVRQESGGEVVENWLPFEKLTVAAPE
ncbi:MAG: FecR domain-containing protein [Novosphingobium sp.]|nr:FecR domain-containing protein [Novosphingobium sp.]